MSIMALDIGSKRIGVAVADPGESYALPVGTIGRTALRADLAAIAEYAERYGATELVVGDPITLRGERALAAQKMDVFVEQLRARFAGPIHRVDERLTTAQATKALIGAGLSRERRKGTVDKMAAALILESYLARRRRAVD